MSDYIFSENGMGYMPGVKAAVTVGDSRDFYPEPDDTIEVESKKLKRGIVPWGENNKLPADLLQKVEKSTDLSSGLFFNVLTGYGDGIEPVRYIYDQDGKVEKVQIVRDNKEINEFFELNDMKRYLVEQLTDLNYFYNTFPELVLNKKRKVVELYHREAFFSRWEEMNDKGVVERHAYSSKWGDTISEEDVIVTSVLNSRRPMLDLLERIGKRARTNGKTKDDDEYRYIVPVVIPTPGRRYYQKPYWYSIIESGWYDFAVAIPQFKKYMLSNQMTIKYHIQIHKNYFPEIFKEENITTEKGKKERIKKEYENIKKILTGMENAGQTIISRINKDQSGNEIEMLKITAIDSNKPQGGDYIGDIEEVSNIIFNSLHVHPSVIGAVPGKNKGSFSGTDKRELFIIKQALLKPIRDRLLLPLYLIKKVNGWPEDIHFAIPNIQLTTLDTNKSGSEKVIQGGDDDTE